MGRPISLFPLLAGVAAALAWPTLAEAHEPKRSGGQAEFLLGGADCIPAKGECESEVDDGGTKGSAGFAVDLGWRAHKAFFLGAGYTVAGFTPTWRTDNGLRAFSNAHQQGVFAVFRAYIPIWRIDIGLELSPGWSRQLFVAKADKMRTFSHGFALRPGLSVDFRLLERLFIGARVDFLLAFHTRYCTRLGNSRTCSSDRIVRQMPVHQVIAGLHFGVNF